MDFDMNQTNMWPDDIAFLCRSLAQVGNTASEIGNAIHKSRCAVIGWCRRNKVNLSRTRRKIVSDELVLTIPRTIKITPRIVCESPKGISSFTHCQYLFGEARNRHFCTNKASHGSWCEGHHRMVYMVKL